MDKIEQEAPGNKQLAEHALGWVLYATRPLSVDELCNILRFSGVSTKSQVSEIVNDVESVCHGLLEVKKQGDDSIFTFIHFSVAEFLMDMFSRTAAQSPRRTLKPVLSEDFNRYAASYSYAR